MRFGVREAGHAVQGALQLLQTRGLGALTQRGDGRRDAASGQPGLEPRRLFINYGLDRADLTPARLEVGFGRRLQVVDVEEVHVVDVAHRALDVAGHGDVDNHQRAVAAKRHRRP